MTFTEIHLTCKDCEQPFVFGAGEQEFFEQRGFTAQPVRCPECRDARKLAGGGKGKSAGGPREMFVAPCTECGKEAHLPFAPRAERPVYCAACFETRRGRG